MVRVRFFGVLSNMLADRDEDGYWKTDASGRTIEEVLSLTPIKNTKVRYSILVNGEHKSPGYVLVDGDTLTVLPLFAGG